MRKQLATLSALLISCITASAGTACPNAAGTMIIHAAWVSPKFVSCSFQSVSPQPDGGKEITFKVVGESRVSKFADKEIWVNGVVVVDSNWKIKTIKWGSHKAGSAPGVTTLLLGRILAGMGGKS